jgi:hypothetical protein
MSHNTTALQESARQLQQLRSGFEQLAHSQISASALGQQARAATTLLQALPPRYGEVLLNLLDRLESSALFTEESCSFSQKDLLDNLRLWADKAKPSSPPIPAEPKISARPGPVAWPAAAGPASCRVASPRWAGL